MRGQRHAPAAPSPREKAGTHFIGGWVGVRAGLDRCGKSRLPPGFDPRTVQPVGSRYTDYATRPRNEAKYYLVCTKRVLLSQNSLKKFIMCELQLKLTTKLQNVDSSLLDNLIRPATYIGFRKGHNIKQSPCLPDTYPWSLPTSNAVFCEQ